MVMISAIPRVKGPAETLGSSFNACKVVRIASPIKQAAVKVKTKEPPITKAALTFCFQYPFHYDLKKILWSLKRGGPRSTIRGVQMSSSAQSHEAYYGGEMSSSRQAVRVLYKNI